jgi:hypothetical protein
MPRNINEQEAVVLLRCLKHSVECDLSSNENMWANDLIADGLITKTIDAEGELLTTNDAGVSALRAYITKTNGDVS